MSKTTQADIDKIPEFINTTIARFNKIYSDTFPITSTFEVQFCANRTFVIFSDSSPYLAPHPKFFNFVNLEPRLMR